MWFGVGRHLLDKLQYSMQSFARYHSLYWRETIVRIRNEKSVMLAAQSTFNVADANDDIVAGGMERNASFAPKHEDS
jgi:hypothetical protein